MDNISKVFKIATFPFATLQQTSRHSKLQYCSIEILKIQVFTLKAKLDKHAEGNLQGKYKKNALRQSENHYCSF